MDMTSMHMDNYMHNAFWHEDQVCITFQFGVNIIPTLPVTRQVSRNLAAAKVGAIQDEPRTSFPPTFNKVDAIGAAQLDTLYTFLVQNGYSLSSFRVTDTLRAAGSIAAGSEDDLNSEVGKYLFTTLDEQGNFVPTMICFFNFIQPNMAKTSMIRTLADLPSMFGTSTSSSDMPPESGMSHAGQDDDNEPEDHDKDDANLPGGNNGEEEQSPVVKLVKLLNNTDNLVYLRNKGVPILAASPIWLTGGTSDPYGSKGVGCPLTPPIPVEGDIDCSDCPGLFPIKLPELPSIFRPMTGDGVKVFVLDTLPSPGDINRAAEEAEENNLLLLDVANNVTFNYKLLPESLADPGPRQAVTGKDIHGKLVGFRMPDHGLFVAGIVHDVAPSASIECVRVLNDYCIGDVATITNALERIQNRMLLVNPDVKNPDGSFGQGDLVNKPVVINMSLVIPPDSEVTSHGFDAANLDDIRKHLLKSIQSLTIHGVIFVASAGNEGDLRYVPMNPKKLRPEALYPAAFSYQGLQGVEQLMMIPVGAVDKHGKPASYSCNPGNHGIATYGGDTPTGFKAHSTDCFTQAKDIDGAIGLYTALSYPALAIEDCESTYPAPNVDGWAYWSGTSFATPIIAAVVARILEYVLRNAPPNIILTPNSHIWNGLTGYATLKTVVWDRLGTDGLKTEIGPMLLAVQKQCNDNDSEEEEEQVEVVSITINEFSA